MSTCCNALLANAGQLSAMKHVERATVADRAHHDFAARSRMGNSAYDRRVVIVLPQNCKSPLGDLGCGEGDEAALVGDIEWIEAEDFAGAAYRVGDRDQMVIEIDHD